MKTITKNLVKTLLVSILFTTPSFAAEKHVATLRGEVNIDVQAKPSAIAKTVNKDIKQGRNYPMQPPVIPHKTRNYEVNLNSNKCMSCHSRNRTQESQAPMVSVTHYMDRDGNFLAEVSPRRYFCNQCHAPQQDVKPLVENTFVDMHTLMKSKVKTDTEH
jgi:cytochrome c-type protein NapB